jgi:hypothetical protein
MTQLTAHGLAVSVPGAWEARIQRRVAQTRDERTFAVLHAASFPLPEQRDDFGGGVTALMRSSDVFITLFEYGPDAANTPLFKQQGMPRVSPGLFSTNRLQRPRPGQIGCQQFFTHNDRAFCLYVVAGSRGHLPSIILQVNRFLDGLDIA